jgi:cytochrome P450
MTQPSAGHASTGTLERFNPNWPQLFADPYPVYDRYRAEDPVHWGLATNPKLSGSWYTFTYDDCITVLGDPRFKSDPSAVGMADAWPPAFAPIAGVFLEWLGALDPPKHSRIRAVMAKAFTPRRIRELEPRIRVIANALLDQKLSRSDSFDLVSSYAFPLPMAVIGDMLGVPEPDREQFRELSTQFARAIDTPGDELATEAGSAAALQMLDYFRGQLELRRAHPADDLMTAMMTAAADDGQVMTEFEILATAIELIVAGHETTVNTAAKATLGMLRDGTWAALAARPEQLSGEGMEELLRWASPLQRQRNRWVTEPIELHGKHLQVGDAVVVMLGAANYDPAKFPSPRRLDMSRPAARHMTFGHGPHLCLGAHLARLELTVALQTLLRRAPDLELRGEVEWRRNALIPGPAVLMVGRAVRS